MRKIYTTTNTTKTIKKCSKFIESHGSLSTEPHGSLSTESGCKDEKRKKMMRRIMIN